MIKTANKLEIELNYLNIVKAIMKSPQPTSVVADINLEQMKIIL